MASRSGGDLTAWIRRGAAAALLAACALPCGAGEPAPARAGGFVPTPRKTREELVREWDLNSDGKIDLGEAEVASSRMRRERAELRLNSGIDPLTGLPRGEPVPEPEPEPAADEAAADMAGEEPPAEPEGEGPAPLPGTRVPRPQRPATVKSQAERKAAGGTQPAGSRAAADAARQPVTGGVRAGGLPARAGHGASVAAPSLNAGLPIAPKTRPPAAAATQPRGGLVPAASPAPAAAPRPTPSRSIGSRDMYDPY